MTNNEKINTILRNSNSSQKQVITIEDDYITLEESIIFNTFYFRIIEMWNFDLSYVLRIDDDFKLEKITGEILGKYGFEKSDNKTEIFRLSKTIGDSEVDLVYDIGNHYFILINHTREMETSTWGIVFDYQFEKTMEMYGIDLKIENK